MWFHHKQTYEVNREGLVDQPTEYAGVWCLRFTKQEYKGPYDHVAGNSIFITPGPSAKQRCPYKWVKHSLLPSSQSSRACLSTNDYQFGGSKT